MEINKHEGLNPLQQFRYELLQWCGKTEDAAKAYQFVMGKQQEAEANQNAQTAQLENNRLKDGVYFVIEGQAPIKFEGKETILPNDVHIEAVGLVMGEFSIKIALQDEAEGKRIPLTSTKNGDDPRDDAPYYIESYEDAIAEMDGDISTDHLSNILNPDIKLQDGWYIPSLGEMYRIFINLKEINAALEFIGETPLYRGWYWTSTERSATGAWYLDLFDGYTGYWSTKASNIGRVRAVSAFINA